MTIQDISCVGKCSLTVALPIISACGIETAVLPTAVLSAHTAFNKPVISRLTGFGKRACDYFEKEGIAFDAVYTGFLGSVRQIGVVKRILSKIGEGKLILVDPAMADNGKLYNGLSVGYVKKMAELCSYADIIVPNLTEACMLSGIPYQKSDYDEDYIKKILIELCKIGCNIAVLTGVRFGDKVGVYAYNRIKKEFFSRFSKYYPSEYLGTGDVFASALCGAMLLKENFCEALTIATEYASECVAATAKDKDAVWYGVEFEKALPYLIEKTRR
ncbi:MAG: pyridoxamine kinase [Christensenellales bacterium]